MPEKEFVADFQLVGNRIIDLKIHNDFIAVDTDSTTETKKKLKLTHSVNAITQGDNGKWSGLLELIVSVKLIRDKQKLTVDLTQEGCFTANAKMDSDEFEKMLEINGISSLYSIARATILSISSQTLVYGNVMLPMINVYNYSEKKKEKVNSESASNSKG